MTTAFYCVSDSRYFLGAVGLINSLRLQGHAEPIHLLDCGLTAEQRALVADEVVLVDAPDDTPPYLLKTIAPLAHPAEVMVLIDVDMIVTRNLGELIETAREGRVVAFENNVDRFVPEWGELLELGEARRHPYLCSGFVAAARDPGEEVLRLMRDLRDRVDFSQTFWRQNVPDYPFLYADQDLLNAILATRVEPDRIRAYDYTLAAPTPFGGLEVTDLESLRCAYPDGVEPFVVHHILPSKPWLAPMYHGVYSQLLMRLLVGPRLAVRLPASQIPVRFRDGARGRIERARILGRDRLGWFARDHLPRSLVDRFDDRRAGSPG